MRRLAAALAAAALAAAAVPATAAGAVIVVNSTGDAADADPADGRCDTGSPGPGGAPECTLRAAIAHANAAAGEDTVTFAVPAWLPGGPGSAGETRLTPATPYPAIADPLVVDGSGDPATPTLVPHRLVLDGSLLGGAPGLLATAPARLRSTTLEGLQLGGDILVETPPTAPEPPDGEPAPDPAPAPDPGAAPVPPTAPDPPAPDPDVPRPEPVPVPPTAPEPSAAPAPVVELGPIGIAVIVNSTRDLPDAAPGDGVCSTGEAITVAEAECTLRAALMEAEASPLIDTVGFGIPESDTGRDDAPSRHWVIRPEGPLPTLARTVTIDGTTQPGGRCAADGVPPVPSVRIDASRAGTAALRTVGGSLTLRGVAIDGSPVAVALDAPARGAVLECDVLGADLAGTAPSDGLEAAVRIAGAQDVTVGGVAPGDGNLLGIGRAGAVRITGAAAVDDTVLGNAYVGSGRIVDLGPAGDQPNDRGDADGGPNGLLNHPEPVSATVRGDTVTVTVRVDAAAGQYRVEFLGVSDPGTPGAAIRPLATERLLTTGGVVTLTTRVTAPAPDGVVAMLTAEEGGAPGPGSTGEAGPMVTPLATQVVSGSVMEDVDGDGQVADDGTGVAGVDVWVFADQGNGVPDAGDPLSRATRTDGVGNWSVTVPGDGTYWAAVDSRDISPAAGLRGGYTWEDAWAEQTYAAAGAVRDDGGSFTFTGAAGALYGGARPAAGDGFPVLSAAEHVHRAVVAGSDVTGLVTGFSFAAVTNTGDDPAAGGFATAGAWSAFDADGAGIGTNPEGYEHQVFDGRYVYFAPSQRSGGRHGEVLRYDTTGAFTDVGSWASFDAGDNGVGSDPDGYVGAVFDGRYVYLAPDDNGGGMHGEVLRYDTAADFQDAGSWDAYDPGDDGVGTDPDGYRGMTWDGRYVYLAPFQNGSAPSGEVLRYDTQGGFASAGSWATFDPSANGVGTDPRGYWAAFHDGRYLYFAPMSNGGGNHGEVLRYDTTAPFAAAGSWSAFDPGANGVGADADGYAAIASDGRYLYLAPYFNGAAYAGEVLRYDLQAAFTAAGSWSVFDPSTAGLGANAVGYRTATFDGRYLYLAQDMDASGSPAGNVLRYDTRAAFGAAGSWDLFDPGAAGVGSDPDGALGASFDGRHLYVSHWYNGTDFSSEVLRYDTARTGQGSLRRVMRNANAITGAQSTVFAIPTSDAGYSASPVGFTVTPAATLPTLVDPVTLDAATQSQAGPQGRPVVAVDGSSAGAANGVTLGAGSGGSTVRGLTVHSFTGDGVRVLTDGNTIAGNRVGIGFDGTTARPNGGDGILVTGAGNAVGGSGATDGNVVAGNGGDGVALTGGSGNDLRRNRIGTNAAGTGAVPNGGDGVRVNGSAAARIGGPATGEGNVIAGNGDDGVSLETGSDGTVVRGNAIGVGADASVIANGDLGVWVASDGNTIGGTAAVNANTVGGNTRAGVLVNAGATGNAILRNAMSGNGGLGIDRNATVITSSAPSDGVTANDPGDGDGILNTPEITSVVEHTTDATVTYDLDVPAGTYRIEFFANPDGADPSGSGEAGMFRLAATVVHPGGSATYTQAMAAADGEVVTATATEDTGGGTFGQTSEISPAVTVVAGNDPPVNTVPAAQTIAEDAPLVFAAGGPLELSVADPDAAAGAMDITLTATNGTLTLSGTAGLSFLTGDGTTDASMRFTGTLAAVNAAFNGAQFTPTLGYAGPASLQIATDDQGNTGVGGPLGDTDTLAITVNAQNDPPVHAMPGAQTVLEDTPLVLGGGSAIQVADPDVGASPLEVDLSASNGVLTLAGVAGLSFTTGDGTIDGTMTFTGTLADVNAALDGLTFSPAGDHVGPASVRIVTDDQGATGAGGALADDDTLGITVTAANDAPVITLPAPVTAPGGTPVVLSSGGGDAITIADVDIGGGPARVTLTATNGTLTLPTTTNLSFVTGDGSLDTTMTFTGTLTDVLAALDGLTFLPTPGYSGAAAIDVDVSDQGATGAGGAQTDSDTLAITLTPNPSAPSLDPIPAKTVPEGAALAFTATATDPDLPGDTLTWSMVGAPAGAAIDPGTGAFTWTPTEQQGPGTYTFAVVVTDGTSASDSTPVQVDVTEVNATPLVDPVADQVTGEGDPVSLQVTATDPDAPAQTLTWSASGLPPGLSLDASTGAITGTLPTGAAAASPYAVTVTVTDTDGASAQVSFAWVVAIANSAPVLQAIPDAAVDEQTALTVTPSASDPDGGPLTFSLRTAPAGMTIDPATGLVRWTPSESQGPETHTVKVAVTDGGTPAMSAERTFTVRVAEVNRPPVLGAVADREVRAGTTLTVTAEATDPDLPENLLSFGVDGPAGMSADDSGTITWTPGAEDVGTRTVTVRVLDDGSPRRQAETTFTVTVTAAPGDGGTAPPDPSDGGVTPLPGPEPVPGPERPAQPPKPAPVPTPGPPARPGKPASPGSRILRFEVPAANPVPVIDDRVTVTLTAPLKALTAVAQLDVPVQLLSMGGAWTVLVISLAGVRRRRRRPFFVVDVPPGRVLRVLSAPNPAAELRFMLRPDAGPVWSRRLPRRRRGARWVEVDTPAGPGHVEARHLRDASWDLDD